MADIVLTIVINCGESARRCQKSQKSSWRLQRDAFFFFFLVAVSVFFLTILRTADIYASKSLHLQEEVKGCLVHDFDLQVVR
jgi:hypothetical protein